MPQTQPAVSGAVTRNLDVGPDWTLIVSEQEEFVLTMPRTHQAVELCLGEGDPDLAHAWTGQDPAFLNRDAFGEGDIHARSKAGATVTLSTWPRDISAVGRRIWNKRKEAS